MVPPTLFFTNIKRLWSVFPEFFNKWTLTLMTKERGVKFAKKNPSWQLGHPENSHKVPENAKFQFWARVNKIDGEMNSYVYLKKEYIFCQNLPSGGSPKYPLSYYFNPFGIIFYRSAFFYIFLSNLLEIDTDMSDKLVLTQNHFLPHTLPPEGPCK